MDVGRYTLLKENYTFLVADTDGNVRGNDEGLYNRDVRFLNRFFWTLPDGMELLLAYSQRPDVRQFHFARMVGPTQTIGLIRDLRVTRQTFDDSLLFSNTGEQPEFLAVGLDVGADFADLFEIRNLAPARERATAVKSGDSVIRFSYIAEDEVETGCEIELDPRASAVEESVSGARVRFEITLAPGQSWRISVRASILNPVEHRCADLPEYAAWDTKAIRIIGSQPQPSLLPGVVRQAVRDVRSLLLSTEHGYVPAAGVPWYVTAFGRDSLLTAHMALSQMPELAEGTLKYLAAYQGRNTVPETAEDPGKIMHERRQGELARTGTIPHDVFYGTVDATPLFVVLLRETWGVTGNEELVRSLKPVWERALAWIDAYGDIDGDGFVEYRVANDREHLIVQGWKDSEDSMSHADGSLAAGSVAPSEVQGYVYQAYLAAADMYQLLKDEDASKMWRDRATALARAFHERYWLEELGTYALALDGRKQPLAVRNSNAGHLLWSGIVPEEYASKVVRSLMSDELWSGWGVRTLGSGERRYNPVSYHNGSVWPHDTALCAAGMARYGFTEEARTLATALIDLAASQADKRLPELIAGYPRTDAPPVPYPVACRPQAWDAASVIYLVPLLETA